MDVRTQLRGGAAELTGAEASTITDATITAEDAATRQVGAIIGASKRKMPTLPPSATNF